MCCKLLAIEEVASPACRWCSHAIPGKGCGIYQDRPAPCRDFECLWLKVGLPAELRPDKSRVVLDSTTDGNRLVAHVDPASPDAFRRGPVWHLLQQLQDQGSRVVIVLGEKRKLLTRERLY